MILKLTNKLSVFNTLTKLFIIAAFLFLMPQIVSKVSIVNTDNLLWLKKNSFLEIIEKSGIEHFLTKDNITEGYASYGLFKEDYASLIQVDTLSVFDEIEYAEVQIEEDVKSYRVISHSFEYNKNYYFLEIGKSIDSIFETEFILKKYALYVLALALIISIIIDFGIHKKLLLPLEQIVQKLKTIENPSSFDYSRTKTSTYDFRYLENTLHSLMRKIEKSFIQEREFIGNVSHELLTPISIIQTKLDNLLNDSEIKDEHLLKIIESKKTLNRLTRIVRTLLMISRIENEEYLLNNQFSLNELIHDLEEEIKDKAEIKKIRLKITLPNENVPILGNRDLLFTMLFNVISNSIKYTPEEGEIKLNCDISNQAVLAINDTGIGIPKDQLESIFSRYKKFNSDSNSFGLGLALVKKIADYHKIKIDIYSELEKGTKVRFTFP